MTARAVIVPLTDSTAERRALFVPGVDGGLRPACAVAEVVRDDLVVEGAMLASPLDRHRVERHAELILEAALRRSGQAPRRLIGYSYGALVALEAAQQALAADLTAPHLILLDTPVIPGRQRAPAPITMLWYIATGAGLELSLSDFEALDPQRRHEVVVRSCAPHSPGFDEPASRALLTTIKASCAAWEKYEPRPYTGPADVVVAEESARTGGSDWSQIFPFGYRTRRVPGGHLRVLAAAGAAALGGALTELVAP